MDREDWGNFRYYELSEDYGRKILKDLEILFSYSSRQFIWEIANSALDNPKHNDAQTAALSIQVNGLKKFNDVCKGYDLYSVQRENSSLGNTHPMFFIGLKDYEISELPSFFLAVHKQSKDGQNDKFLNKDRLNNGFMRKPPLSYDKMCDRFESGGGAMGPAFQYPMTNKLNIEGQKYMKVKDVKLGRYTYEFL